MEIIIYYCNAWEFEPAAAGLADELFREFQVKAKLIPGTNGIFDVIINGRKIFSRMETGRVPEPGEISRKLKAEGG
jgi:selenoprotein W-related protein